MALQKLATELEETNRQTRELVASISESLNVLMDKDLSDAHARNQAITSIMVGLQAQDRIEQRCANIQVAIKKMSECTIEFNEECQSRIWSSLSLDELSNPEMSGISARMTHGDVDLF